MEENLPSTFFPDHNSHFAVHCSQEVYSICYELCSGGAFCSEMCSGDLFCYALYFINVRTFVFTRFISSFYYVHYLLQFTMEIVCLIICYESTN
jgi:hypothetical protein